MIEKRGKPSISTAPPSKFVKSSFIQSGESRRSNNAHTENTRIT